MIAERFNPAVQADIYLPADIFPGEIPFSNKSLATPLLTGATGFLGVFVLADLLSKTAATVYCLVRAANTSLGEERLRANAGRYGLNIDWNRVRVVPGDFAEPQLGLSNEEFEALASVCDSVYHIGAAVSFAPAYDEIRKANIGGTIEILRFASLGQLKPVHYVSTYAVFNEQSYTGQTLATEQDVQGTGAGFKRGYAQSKWVVEKLCEQARMRGIPVCIYRAGIISGNSADGCCNPLDLMSLIFYTVQQHGIAQDTQYYLHLTPVDYCSRTLVDLSLAAPAVSRTYHLVNPEPISWQAVLDWINVNERPIQRMQPVTWYNELKRKMLANRYLMPLYFLLQFDPNRDFWCNSNILHMRFDTSAIRQTLGTAHTPCPVIDPPLLAKYFDYLKQHGERLYPRTA